MKRKAFMAMLVMASTIGFGACSDDNGDEDGDQTDPKTEAYQKIAENYTDVIVLPTYAAMRDEAMTLLEKVEAFAEADEAHAQAALQAVCDQWRNTRHPWEMSEAFLFGPADTYNLDPKIDTWPLSEKNISDYINSNISLNIDDVREDGLAINVRGFHTMEYLAFENGQARNAADLNDRWKEYMIAVATVLRDDCVKLWYYWNGPDNVPASSQEVLDEIEVEVDGGFAERFTTPNLYDQSYKTYIDVINQIVDGCTDICGEVGEQKIGGPYNLYKANKPDEAVAEVESWYSWNSLVDYEDNIVSIQHSYLGNMSESIDAQASANSISAYIAAENPAVDTEIRNAIKTARNAIAAIPAPFRNNLNASAEIDNAMDELANLENSLKKIKTVIK